MLPRNRYLLLLMVGVVLAVLSFSIQYLQPIPTTPLTEDGMLGKNRKRVNPVVHTESPELDPISDAYRYCNLPNHTEHTREGHSLADYKLLFVQVMIRHGDRYPLYTIPQTKRPAIDCTLSPHRKPSHPLLASFISHMAQGGRGHWDASLGSLARVPNHSSCELGELTQTGVVQHLKNGELLRQAYLKHHKLLPPDWSSQQLWLETTAKSRTLQSGLALLYGFLPNFDWSKVTVWHQRSTMFCGTWCECPARSLFLDEEQRRQYRLRTSNAELEQTYVAMAKALGVATRTMRAANPIDALLCHFCHGLPFPCASPHAFPASEKGACLTLQHFAVIRQQQRDDERERKEAGIYRRFAVLAAHPFLNRTAVRMEKAAHGNSEPVFALASAHDITMAPVLSALGLEGAGFPRFAARLVFELWKSPDVKGKGTQGGVANAYIRVLYNGEDLTFETAFCRNHDRHSTQPLCPLGNFLSFVRKDMFSIVNATSYHQACHQNY
ncbi:2-phosphoxylose phosphatase 1 isoform X1 [Ictalurus punctatus]|uniref:2-phosphoxylose phosphatase 1 n=1 Tax=Ictalurus punctatus TaxID=7998 RepID=A0A2D0SUH3_ICTPU|nr:2-phosphoxylose phosphatase 1 isoform X1 [Ictalurus punctatus]